MSAKHILETYTKLHANKIGAHCLWTAIERLVAGESEAEVMRDFGYVALNAGAHLEGCDYCNSPLFSDRECKHCGRVRADWEESRLQVLEREHAEFFERWHAERRKREALEQAAKVGANATASEAAAKLRQLAADMKELADWKGNPQIDKDYGRRGFDLLTAAWVMGFWASRIEASTK